MKREPAYDNLRWLSGRDLSRYIGKWIVIRNRRIVAADKDLEKAIRKANLPPDETPLVHRVPKEPHLVLEGHRLGAHAVV